MRLRELAKRIAKLETGGDWRTVESFKLANINAVRAAGSSMISNGSVLGLTQVGNATGVLLIDDTASETRFIAAALGDDVVAGVEIELRLRQAVLAAGAQTQPSINADSETICELIVPALSANDVEYVEGEPGEAISSSLCVVEIEVRAPGGVWPTGGNVVLIGQLQVR